MFYPLHRILITLVLVLSPALAAESPRNVILVIGDGMGWDHLTAARLQHTALDQPLAMESLPVSGLMSTHPAGPSRVTDSAASATAMATGHKTTNGRIATLPDGRAVTTLFEILKARDWLLGVVTDGDLNGATAAAFTAHAQDRGDKSSIAVQMLALRPDLLLGSVEAFPLPGAGEATDWEIHRDVRLTRIPPATSAAPLLVGYTTMVDEAASLSLKRNVPGPFAPTLAVAAEFGLTRLTERGGRFFMLLENDSIDSWSHDNAFELTAHSVYQLDQAVAAAVAFAARDGETLVVVTADHECGGLTLPERPDGSIGHHFSTEEHTAAAVPLFAYGPGADRFGGARDNAELHGILLDLMFPAADGVVE